MELSQEQIEFLDKVVYGDWTLTSEGKVDVDGWVNMSGMGMPLTNIPVKFGRVSRWFDCSHNNLTSLDGCPDYVEGAFNCSRNNLTSLEFVPLYVGVGFYCYNNNLTNYFKNIKEEDFKHWDKLGWRWWNMIEEYPFLINIAKNYVDKEDFIELIKKYPKTKLYLK